MGSQKTLWGLVLVGGILGGVLGIDLLRPESNAAVDRRVVPELADADLVGVRIEPSDSPSIRLVLRDDGRFAIVEPLATLVSGDAQDELTFTLRRLSFRRKTSERLTEPRAKVVLEVGSQRIQLVIGAPIEATGQVWIGRPDVGRAYVVDDYAVEVLLRGVDQLRERSVWSGSPRRALEIVLSAQGKRIALAGARAEIGGISARADPGALIRVASMLDRLRFESFQSPVPPAEGGLAVRVVGDAGAQELTELGPCSPTLVLVAGPVGTGCVDRATLDSLRDTAIGGRTLWDRDLFSAADTETITLTAGDASSEVQMSRPEARQWLARLRAATGDHWLDTPSVDPVASVKLTQRDGSVREIDIYRGPIAARRGEKVALHLELEVAALLEPGPNRFRSRSLIERDPSEVSRIAVAGVADIQRGQLIGEWTSVKPPGAEVDGEAIADVARVLSELTATEFVEGELGKVSRTIEVTMDATPMGDPEKTHTLRMGARCRATLDSDTTVFVLPKQPCATLMGSWWR